MLINYLTIQLTKLQLLSTSHLSYQNMSVAALNTEGSQESTSSGENKFPTLQKKNAIIQQILQITLFFNNNCFPFFSSERPNCFSLKSRQDEVSQTQTTRLHSLVSNTSESETNSCADSKRNRRPCPYLLQFTRLVEKKKSCHSGSNGKSKKVQSTLLNPIRK